MWFPGTTDSRTQIDEPHRCCDRDMSLKPLVFSMAIGCLAMAADIDAGEDPGAKLSAPAESDQVARVAAIERLELDAAIRSNVIATYKDGFILETIGEGETPFPLKVNGRM